jgi:hypothetical protein
MLRKSNLSSDVGTFRENCTDATRERMFGQLLSMSVGFPADVI